MASPRAVALLCGSAVDATSTPPPLVRQLVDMLLAAAVQKARVRSRVRDKLSEPTYMLRAIVRYVRASCKCAYIVFH